ncbi:hypothetical protein PPERSA_02113 [Pseudocohnilembus persalinus]|uniref:NAD-dependent epimerase/dehydratase domain-containing protein n=1 Tax=Pseudocohnilembus persalinus TaxID=266149 RepID=A0A0V0Q7Z7_PSEPJ|nr:hypothetical protein PPERSA_02113 [Pseudocohnilembus persalinus]|eukprot:KRW98336.1 hypothetical protein PPERSA_02113 [Pseudocohnilembus persalinus]
MSQVPKYLIIGGGGQIGPVLLKQLRNIVGNQNVVLSDMRNDLDYDLMNSGPFYQLDVTNGEALSEIVKKEKITGIYHLAALLSGRCEEVPELAFKINQGGLQNVLEVARLNNCQVFYPSTIGVFGKFFNPNNTIQDSHLRPTSIYGITKVFGELLCDYYHNKYGVDTRGVRYPGIISTNILGGGTTDYAVYMPQHAVQKKDYDCFLLPDTRLDMMHIDDAVNATIQLMHADPSKLVHRNSFNITAMNFTPHELHKEIQKYYPEFNVSYNNINNLKQKIADSWPNNMSSSCAEAEWGFKPIYDFESMVKMVIDQLKQEQQLQQSTQSTQQTKENEVNL